MSQGNSLSLQSSVNCLAHTEQQGQSLLEITRPDGQSEEVTFFSHGTLLHKHGMEVSAAKSPGIKKVRLIKRDQSPIVRRDLVVSLRGHPLRDLIPNSTHMVINVNELL